jgi:glutamine synthetase
MKKTKLEYIWLDGYKPTQNLRSKTMIVSDFSGKLEDCEVWSFDGSSTQQAVGNNSDCLLKPVALYPDPGRIDAYIVLTEVLNSDETPHPSNKRATIDGDNDFWFGFEQEYTLIDLETNRPIGFPTNGYPEPQGQYYCSVGATNAIGRQIIEDHLDTCIQARLNIEGINSEVMMGQWEYQIFSKNATEACDQIWASRYFLERITEQYNVKVEWGPKPVKGDWNGSGIHANFSNKELRESGDKKIFDKICEEFKLTHKEHIAVYGAHNEDRLTGKHETQDINTFSYGVSDRSASLRIPIATVKNDWKGRIEDRRPASDANPYDVAAIIIKTVKKALQKI